MTLTGLNIRYFTDSQSGTFIFQNLQTSAIELYSGGQAANVSGQELRLGFTGVTGNRTWYFSFRNGKMYDPEGRWFGCYNDTDINTVSGNFAPTGYDYYLNNQLMCSVGNKSGVDFNGFYSQSISGASGQADIYVYTAPITCSLLFAPAFYNGGNWSGSFSHQNVGPVTIRSGVLLLDDAAYFAITGSGLSWRNGQNIVPTGATRTIVLANTGTSDRTGMYTLGVRIFTDFGNVDFTVSGSGVPISSGTISNSLINNTGWDFRVSGSGVTGYNAWYFANSYISFTDGTEQPKPLYVELSYISGATGTFTRVTGISLSNSGAGYTSQPLIYVTPTGGGYPIASGLGILFGTGLQGIQWTSTGYYTGYTGSYGLVFSGGGGSNAAGGPQWDTSYTKTFSGQFSLYTGFFGLSLYPTPETLISASGKTIFTGNVLTLSGVFVGTPDSAWTRYVIKASGLPDSTSGTYIYSGSGLGYKG